MNDRGRKVPGDIADTHARDPVVGSIMVHDGRLRIRFVVFRIVKSDRERRQRALAVKLVEVVHDRGGVDASGNVGAHIDIGHGLPFDRLSERVAKRFAILGVAVEPQRLDAG